MGPLSSYNARPVGGCRLGAWRRNPNIYGEQLDTPLRVVFDLGRLASGGPDG